MFDESVDIFDPAGQPIIVFFVAGFVGKPAANVVRDDAAKMRAECPDQVAVVKKTGWVTRWALNAFGTTVGLDLDKFNQCLDEHKYKDKVNLLYQFGKDLGIDATPSFLIFNGEKIIKIRGNQPLETFLRTIDEL